MENLHGIKRTLGSRQIAKKPILINELKLIINVIDKDKNEKKRAKNRALILVGFAGGFRRSELVAILFEDIDFVPEGIKIFIRRSKTDQSGEGTIKAIPYFDNEKYCPVKALKNYMTYRFATSAAEFGAEERNIMAMTGHKTTQMVRRYIQEANLFKNNVRKSF